MELLGRVAFEAARLRPFVPTYLHLLASALFPIYTGAHASLSRPSSAARPKKKAGAEEGDFNEEPEDSSFKTEGLTPKDAILFPLLAGFTLSSLYFIIKWLEDPRMLNKILSYYFMQVGVVFGTKFLKDVFTVVRSFCLPSQYSYGGIVWKVNGATQRYEAVDAQSDSQEAYCASPLAGPLRRISLPKKVAGKLWAFRSLIYAKCSLKFHIHKLVTIQTPVQFLDALAIGTSLAVVGIFTFLYQAWYVSNLLGFAFCYGSMQYMSPTTFWTGTLLLSALFFYDIYFVFFTPMMVTVATKLDIPIKLLFPRPPSPAEAEKGISSLAMLGLGDIVIPGMMVALALRFDLYLYYLRRSKRDGDKVEKPTYAPVTGGWGERFWVGRSAAGSDLQAKAFPKTYFKAGLVGYASGMVVTLLVMQIAEHAQPALLYLVPGVLTSLWGTAALKGDLKLMWDFTEDDEAEKKRLSSKKAKDKTTKGTTNETDKQETTQANETDASIRPSKGSEKRTSTAELEPDSEDSSSSSAVKLDMQSNHAISHDGEPKVSSASKSESESASTTEKKHRDRSKRKVGGISAKAEDKCRHLIHFSIDFPASPTAAEDKTSTKSGSGARDADAGHGKEEKRPLESKEGDEEISKGDSKLGDQEPPGKRRRVK
jgi:minor histocompatibility antigen H13